VVPQRLINSKDDMDPYNPYGGYGGYGQYGGYPQKPVVRHVVQDAVQLGAYWNVMRRFWLWCCR